MENDKYGVITEQGDLGLGFSLITESEQDIIKKNMESQEKK